VTSEDPEVVPEVAELPLLPYLVVQGEALDALRDESGEVPYDPDG